ncbi:hypothetical protein [Roseobacter litoralis]|uniref:CD-NTase-associated protein 15 domain-containing protein n=1 Tax=Roseobacter litoralis (strain ATCC 49566 / DSM 6996 / JCM 21268 / NBRC 15278 / OCh 149) TaxID=391595 RepID=F7ZB96_ROSLO|nr:hypothetical protein [Roseobacter litoralis]AEI93089.1 hypothetical protein RLO149_c010820 [Roseobacter litoralis Och 149]
MNFAFFQPQSDPSKWPRTLTATPGTFGLLIGFLGATPTWRWFWKKFPKLNEWVFPDLNGEWETVMMSNICVMAESHPDFKNADTDKISYEISGKFTIKQNWFRIKILYDATNKYTKSRTLVVQPKRDADKDCFSLAYIYVAETIAPQKTDEQHHFGAAMLEVNPDWQVLSGPYWTNRNAQKGLNTAGTLEAKRLSQ